MCDDYSQESVRIMQITGVSWKKQQNRKVPGDGLEKRNKARKNGSVGRNASVHFFVLYFGGRAQFPALHTDQQPQNQHSLNNSFGSG